MYSHPLMIDIESFLSDRLPFKLHLSFPPLEPGIKSSAVLVPLLKEGTIWKILFTVRSDHLADHGGQIAFPGGRTDPGDAGPLQTALREAREEIGVPSEEIRPAGILDPIDTHTGFRIWPVVGILRWPQQLTLSLPEVREVFFVPVEWLMRPDNSSWRPVDSPAGHPQRQALFFHPFQGRIIWGATAAITLQLMEILREGWTA
jgi:8-oxo-dGTP pyrophosphatase MutT (NUDIX family)